VTELVKILRRREVERFTGLRRSSIYEGMGDGTFPRAITIGRKSIGWLESEIIAWQQQRIAQRNARFTTSRRKCRRSKESQP
jgi:prophage regulatory protein